MKDEFRRHKSAGAEFVNTFMREWCAVHSLPPALLPPVLLPSVLPPPVPLYSVFARGLDSTEARSLLRHGHACVPTPDGMRGCRQGYLGMLRDQQVRMAPSTPTHAHTLATRTRTCVCALTRTRTRNAHAHGGLSAQSLCCHACVCHGRQAQGDAGLGAAMAEKDVKGAWRAPLRPGFPLSNQTHSARIVLDAMRV